MKRGFTSIVDRLERGCFFHFNCASQNLTPDALTFLTRIVNCISPTVERTKEQVHVEKVLIGTKLVFIPEIGRDPWAPLSLQKQTYIHRSQRSVPDPRSVCCLGNDSVRDSSEAVLVLCLCRRRPVLPGAPDRFFKRRTQILCSSAHGVAIFTISVFSNCEKF